MDKELERFMPHYEMNEINKTLKLIFRVEKETLLNGNDSSLKRLDDEVLEMLVDYWYKYKSSAIIKNKKGLELDELLEVHNYKF